MGAAASIKQIYKDGYHWFREYIDTETYLSDFRSLDSDGDGGIEFGELKKWIDMKNKTEGGSWGIFKSNLQILSIAHKVAAMSQDKSSSANASKVVDVGEFKSLLINLFAISILWKYFDFADHIGDDVGNKQLSREQFGVAVKVLTATHANENLSETQIDEDFDLIDTNRSGTIGFMEVCNYCTKHLIPQIFSPGSSQISIVPKFFGTVEGPQQETLEALHAGPKSYYLSSNTDTKTTNAVEALASKMEIDLGQVYSDVKQRNTFRLIDSPSAINLDTSTSTKQKDVELIKEMDPPVISPVAAAAPDATTLTVPAESVIAEAPGKDLVIVDETTGSDSNEVQSSEIKSSELNATNNTA